MKQSAYKEAGVDIDAGADLVERIKPAVKKTVRDGVMDGLGGFGALFDLKKTGYTDPLLVSSTDGVGTKLKIAIDTGIHDTVGIDLVAMCVNDLIVQGAEPLFFLDYFACGKLDVEAGAAIISGIAKGCEEAGCALIGGETAEMPGMYGDGDYDLAGFTVGAVERNAVITGSRVQEGDVIIGLAASGLHSNGFSLVRKLVETTQGYDYGGNAPFAKNQTLGQALLTPTRIYVRSILQALKLKDDNDDPIIKAIANITGGGLIENIPRSLPDGVCAILDAESWPLLPVFSWLADIGSLEAEDMATTLNCGLGMTLISHPDHADILIKSLQESGETVHLIGHVEKTDDLPQVRVENMIKSWKN